MYIYPENLKAKATLWFWILQDLVLIGIFLALSLLFYLPFSSPFCDGKRVVCNPDHPGEGRKHSGFYQGGLPLFFHTAVFPMEGKMKKLKEKERAISEKAAEKECAGAF